MVAKWNGNVLWMVTIIMNMCGMECESTCTQQYGPRREKTCLQGVTNNTNADQPVHSRSQTAACASTQSDQDLCYSFFGRTICKLASGELSIF